MNEDLKIIENAKTEYEIKFSDVSKAKLMTLTCPRCKIELTVRADILTKVPKVICTSCLAEFKLNYAKRQELFNLINPTVEVENESNQI